MLRLLQRAMFLPGRVGAVTSLPSGTRLVVETPALIVAFARGNWIAAGVVEDPAIVAFSPNSAHVIPQESATPDPRS